MKLRVTLAAALLGSTLLGACSDGVPAFCSTLRDNAQLDELSSAIAAGDLERAEAEARRLGDIADQAPPEIRRDLRAIGDAVAGIVQHLVAAEDPATDSSEAERDRDRLNDELGSLEPRIGRVSTWAQRECGLNLD